MGAYSKVPKGRETTDGGVTPGNCATTRKVPKGRQRYKQFDIKQAVCGLSRLDFVDLWFGAFPRTAINKRKENLIVILIYPL